MKCSECDMFIPFPHNPEKGICSETLSQLIYEKKISIINLKTDCYQIMLVPQENKEGE